MATEEFGEVETPSVEVKLFGKWSADEVHVNDISLAVSTSCVTLSAMKIVTLRGGGVASMPWTRVFKGKVEQFSSPNK